MSNELKDCPFCGAAPLVQEIEPHVHGLSFGDFRMPDHNGSFTVECPTINCCGMIASTMEEVAAAWNRRPALATPAVASGALPELPETDGVININVYTDEDAWNADSMRLYGHACAAAAAPNAALVAALKDGASALEEVEADRFNVDMDAVSMAAISARAALAQAGESK